MSLNTHLCVWSLCVTFLVFMCALWSKINLLTMWNLERGKLRGCLGYECFGLWFVLVCTSFLCDVWVGMFLNRKGDQTDVPTRISESVQGPFGSVCVWMLLLFFLSYFKIKRIFSTLKKKKHCLQHPGKHYTKKKEFLVHNNYSAVCLDFYF